MCDLPHLTTNCFLGGKPYVLNLTVSKLSLTLTLTNKNTFEKWKCTPSVEYIESMTRKTGNFKTFAVFADMMRAVFLNASASLSMKLLTQGELEKINDSSLQATLPDSHAKKRIYFILVYTSEFDRIHYPLPMDYAGLPNPEILQATIHGLEKDKCNLLKELEKCKVKSEMTRQVEMTSLKKCLAETAKQCGELSRKCQTILDEFAHLKMRFEEDRESWKREIFQLKQEYDCKIGSVSGQVETIVGLVQTMRNKLPIPQKRDLVANRGDAPRRLNGRMSDSSLDKSPVRRASPRRPFNGRPRSPGSVGSYGSIRAPTSASSSASKLSKKSVQPNRIGSFHDRQSNFCPNFSDNDVNSVRQQIETLQKAVLGLTKNLNTKM